MGIESHYATSTSVNIAGGHRSHSAYIHYFDEDDGFVKVGAAGR